MTTTDPAVKRERDQGYFHECKFLTKWLAYVLENYIEDLDDWLLRKGHEELREWYAEHQQIVQRERDLIRKQALHKLTAEEREVLGFGKAEL